MGNRHRTPWSSLANQSTLTEGLQVDFPTCLHPYAHTHTHTCTHHLHIHKQATTGSGSLYYLLSGSIVAILILIFWYVYYERVFYIPDSLEPTI